MLTVAAIILVVVGLPTIFFGLASAFIPVYGGSQTSSAPGFVAAIFGALMVIVAICVLAIT